jgi:hypothetical protein
MVQESFFDISQTTTLGGCTLLVLIITSTIHHLVGKITWYWNPKWGSFFLSSIIGAITQIHFIKILEPIHILIILGNICLIYLSAAGFNATVGEPAISIAEREQVFTKGISEIDDSDTIVKKENWRTRWFD